MGTNHDCIGIKFCHECQSQIKDDEPYVRFKIPVKTDRRPRRGAAFGGSPCC